MTSSFVRHTWHCVAVENGERSGRGSSFHVSIFSSESNSLTQMTPGVLKRSSGGMSLSWDSSIPLLYTNKPLGKYLMGPLELTRIPRKQHRTHTVHLCENTWRTSDERGCKWQHKAVKVGAFLFCNVYNNLQLPCFSTPKISSLSTRCLGFDNVVSQLGNGP